MNNRIINIPKNFTVEEVLDFRAEINNLIDENVVDFIFDFSICEFIDSTGLGALVSIYKKCVEKNGSVKLNCLKPAVQKLFNLTRLDKVFEIS